MRVSGLPSWSSFKPLGIAGVVLLLLLAGAFLWDMMRISERTSTRPEWSVDEEVRQIILGTTGPPWTDPAGRFQIVPPAGWDIRPQSDDNFYDVSFVHPGRASLNILVSPVAFNELRYLADMIRRRERDFDVYLPFETVKFQEWDALARVAQLPGKKMRSYDFVHNFVAYHILFEIPDDYEREYTFAIEETLKTFKLLGADTNTPPAPAP